MPALHAFPTTGAMSDLNMKPTDNGLADNLFLVLKPGFLIDRLCATALRLRRKRHRNLFVHPFRNRPVLLLSIAFSRFAPRWLRIRLWFPSRKWRRLTLQRA